MATIAGLTVFVFQEEEKTEEEVLPNGWEKHEGNIHVYTCAQCRLQIFTTIKSFKSEIFTIVENFCV